MDGKRKLVYFTSVGESNGYDSSCGHNFLIFACLRVGIPIGSILNMSQTARSIATASSDASNTSKFTGVPQLRRGAGLLLREAMCF